MVDLLGNITHLAIEAAIRPIVVVQRVKLDSTLRATETVPEEIWVGLFGVGISSSYVWLGKYRKKKKLKVC